MICTQYPSVEKTVHTFCQMPKRVSVHRSVVCGHKGISFRSFMTLAHWCRDNGKVNCYDAVELALTRSNLRMLHNIVLNGKPVLHLWAKVK